VTAEVRSDGTNQKRVRRGLVAAAAVLTTALVAGEVVTPPSPAAAVGGESIISTFYVPLFEDNSYDALESVNAATGPALSTTISVTVTASGTIVYYDHWEDGFEAIADEPSQTSTRVYGDGNPSNGDAADVCVPIGCAGDQLRAGAVLRLNNSTTIVPGSLSIPRSAATVVFDGRDKISSTAGLAISHATWPTNTDALHAQMASAFDTSRWGVSFVSPVGTNTPQQGDGVDHFSYSGVEVMAATDGTQVWVDANADGDFLDAGDRNGTTIDEGETVFVNGGIAQGARVQSSVPVQVFLMTGRIGSNYANRSFQLFPTEGLVNDYLAPATAASAPDAQASVLYLFNPQTTSIPITVTTQSGSTNYTIPAGQVLNPAPFLAPNEPARVTSTATFAAIAATGTREGAQGQDFDWGYSLVPARLLSTSINVGWAPGSQNLSNSTYNPVWVTATGATTLYVDLDGDPTTGPNLDPNGSRYDTSYPITGSLRLVKVTDTSDNDMTGARIYTTNGVTIASVYGEDPSTAPTGFPGIDLGTALFPSCGALCVTKSATLLDDVDGDGQIDPGDLIEWRIDAANTGYIPLTNTVLRDPLQAGLDYVSGSTSIGAAPAADDVVPPSVTEFPFDEAGRNLGTIAVGATVTVRFETRVANPYTGPPARVVNTVRVIADQARGGDTVELPIDSLRLTKTSNAAEPVVIGSTIDYTLTVTNEGTSTLAPVTVTDALPPGLNWVSTTVTRPVWDIDTISDNFSTSNWSGSSGSQAWSQASWVETNEVTTSPIWNTGQIRAITDLSSVRLRIIGSASNQSISRVAGDLTGYSQGVTLSYNYRRSGLEADDVVVAEVRPNGSASWTTLGTYSNGPDAAYLPASFDVSGLVGTATQVRFRVTNALDDTSDIFFVDDVTFTASDRVPLTAPGAAPATVAVLPELLGGESATIVVAATVTAAAPDDIVNTGTATSGSFISRASVTNCVRCFDFGDVPASYDGADPGRARVIAPVVTTSATVADDFAVAADWSGSTGSAPWSAGAWTEIDGGGAGTGAGRIRKISDIGDLAVRWANGSLLDEGISRAVGDLSAVTTATLSFARRCVGLEAGDAVVAEIRPDASSAWQVLATFNNCNDAAYVAQSYALTAGVHMGSATEVRFRVSDAFAASTPDNFFVDDVVLDLTTVTATPVGPRYGSFVDRELAPASAAPGGAPIGDDLAGSPDDEDGVTLPSIDTNVATVTFQVIDPTGGVTYVNGWYDWNRNGVFDASESIYSAGSFVSATGGLVAFGGIAAVPGPGTYTVSFNVPNLETNGSGYTVGDSIYSRFRIATNGSDITAGKARGRSSDGEVEDYRTTLNTLPVSLAYFESTRTGTNQVRVQWRTAQEVDNLGFQVYGERRDGTLVTLNRTPILSKAPTSIEPQSYETTVRTAAPTLWLEDIALDGTREMHGPFSVGEPYGDPTPPEEIEWDETIAAVDALEASRTREAVAAARRVSQQRQAELARSGRVATTGPLATFTVDTPGVHQVTHEQLVAIGVDLTGVRTGALAVTDPQGPIPIEIVGPERFGPGSALRFVGTPLDTLYSGENVYRLRLDASRARRITHETTAVVGARHEKQAADFASVRSTRTTAEVEKQLRYSVTAPGADPWFERSMVVIGGRTSTSSATIATPDLVGGTPATASVDLWGISRSATEDEHHVRLAVNGVVVADARFDDTDGFTLRGDIPLGVLGSGDNRLTVSLIGDTGAAVSMVAVDRWSIDYERRNVAVGGVADLVAAGRRVDVTGLGTADVLAYRVVNRTVVASIRTVRYGDTTMMNGRPRAVRYVVTTPDELLTPDIAPAMGAAQLFGARADYLIISHGTLLDSVQPLVDHHTALGRRVKVVDVADIYATYSGGVVDAAAIDTYVARATRSLGVRWLLIAGADSIDYRDHDGDGSVSLVPSLYGRTGFNITFAPIDPAYADIDGDGVPDVAMGRLPARTPAEMDAMVATTLRAAGRSAPQTVTLVSDTTDGVDFAAVNDGLAESFAGWTVRRADIDRQGVEGARAEITGALAEGTAYTMYLGHSSTHQWTSLGLFDAAAARSTPSSHPTVVVQFGCWNTYYVSPHADTMSHSFLLNPNGSAAAVLGASTLTSAANDIALAGYLADGLASGSLTLGEVLLDAKRSVERSAGGTTADVLLGWTLLGDPASDGVDGG
jgi:uncharacterized repeat protein (TIGR01451 family)